MKFNNKQIFFSQNRTTAVECLGYGYLYNWCAVACPTFAPTGWAVPSCADFTTLKTNLGGYTVAGGHLKETGTTHWCSPNTGADNSSGFKAWGVGWRFCSGNFQDFGCCTLMWGRDVCTPASQFRSLSLVYNCAWAYATYTQDNSGQSVRLIYTGASSPSTVTDYDGNIYPVICVGTQKWTCCNWKSTHYNDGTAISKVTDNTAWNTTTSGAYSAFCNCDPWAL